MIDFISNILTFPWWVFFNFFVYAFGVLVYYMIYKALEMYVPWSDIVERFKGRK